MTDLLALLIGGYALLSAFLMITQPNLLDAIFDGFEDNPALSFSVGIFTFFGGGLLVGNHNLLDTYKEVIVSSVGWAALVKGAIFIALPTVIINLSRPLVKTRLVVQICAAITAIFGLILVGPALLEFI